MDILEGGAHHRVFLQLVFDVVFAIYNLHRHQKHKLTNHSRGSFDVTLNWLQSSAVNP